MSSFEGDTLGRTTATVPEHPTLCDTGAPDLSVRIQGLNYYYGRGELRKQVLFDNNLCLARGEIVIMTGPSGSGKTTLLTLIGALRKTQEGSLQVMDRELSGLSPPQLVDVRRGIGFIFQAHNLFESLTALQNVRMALELKERSASVMNARAQEMLTLLGLGHRVHYKPEHLSGGQRQRVAIARALVNRPSLILADEPTAALDKESGRDVVELLRKFAKEQRTTIMIVTHDNRILDVADRIVNMVDGRVISDVRVAESAAISDFLHKVPLFAGLTPLTLSEVADRMVVERFAEGATVIHQGEEGHKFYIIRAGAAEVTVENPQGERVVAELGPGDFFGEAALLSGNPRNATVRAIQPLQLYALGQEEFQRVTSSSGTFQDEVRKALFARQ